MHFPSRENPDHLFKLADINQLLSEQLAKKKQTIPQINLAHLSTPFTKKEDKHLMLRESIANFNQTFRDNSKIGFWTPDAKEDEKNKVIENTKYYTNYLTKAQMMSSRTKMNIIKSPNERKTLSQISARKTHGDILIIRSGDVQKDDWRTSNNKDKDCSPSESGSLEPTVIDSDLRPGLKKNFGIRSTKIWPSKRTLDFEKMALPQDSKDNISMISVKFDPYGMPISQINSFNNLLENSKAKVQERERISSKILPRASSFQRIANSNFIAPIIKKTRTVLPNFKSSKSVKFLEVDKPSDVYSEPAKSFRVNKKQTCCLIF